jgi:hypothetical protein
MRLALLLVWVILLACETPREQVDPYAQIQDEKARAIIQTSIEHAGGIARWQNLKRLSYTKDFQLFLESGEVEKTYEQVHDYQYDPLIIDIQSVENGQTIHTRLEEGIYTRTIDGTPADASQDVLEKAINTSTYVIGMPFKLLDPGAKIRYEGEATMHDGRTVDVIRVDYNAEAYDNHSTTDTWKYYFDKTDRKIVANWVKTSDHYSLVENISFVRADGILFNRQRKSYRVDSLGNRLWLRASYLYDNYQLDQALSLTGNTTSFNLFTLPFSNQPMDTIRLADQNNNKYLITGEALKYQPIRAVESSSGIYSGGEAKEIALSAAQWQKVQELAQAILDNTSSHTETRQKLTSVIKVSQGLHKHSHIINKSRELDAFITYLNSLLDG